MAISKPLRNPKKTIMTPVPHTPQGLVLDAQGQNEFQRAIGLQNQTNQNLQGLGINI